MTEALAYDVFIDLSQAGQDAAAIDAYLCDLRQEIGCDPPAARVGLVMPPAFPLEAPAGYRLHREITAADALWLALEAAMRRKRHLLVLLAPLVPSSATLATVLKALEADPLFGTAQPRFADATTDVILSLPDAGLADSREPSTNRTALAMLPQRLVTADLPASCLLVRREAMEAMMPPFGMNSAAGALAFAICQARRCGFRNVVANHAVVASTLDHAKIYPPLSPQDAAHLAATYPDAFRAAQHVALLPQRRLEALLSAAHPGAGQPRTLLLDCRGLGPLFNGTSVCMLGLLSGLASLQTGWRITVLSQPEAAAFHDLPGQFPNFEHCHGEAEGRYTAALMPNQPWDFATVSLLHRHALVVGFTILDTISWDILYPMQDHVAATWRFIARHADALAFISGFSMDRFRERFAPAPDVVQRVAYLSMRRDEQCLSECEGLLEGNHVLLFGNGYDHKALDLTLRILIDAFPLQRFVVLGGTSEPTSLIRAIPSGQAEGQEVHRLLATARAIVYPSFYEGFGLPVVEGLAYGRAVLVRRSSIWGEIAGHSRLPGRLLEFEDAISLTDRLGRVLDGLPVAELPTGTALPAGATGDGWREYAAKLIDMLELGVRQSSADRWLHRHEALRI